MGTSSQSLMTINMKKLILFVLIITLFSCNERKRHGKMNDSNKSQNFWTIYIRTYGAPWEPYFCVTIANTDSISVEKYISKNDSINGKSKCFLEKKIKFNITNEERLEIYNLTKRTLKEFDFPKHEHSFDGASISIELNENETSLKCEYDYIGEIENASPDVEKIVNLINKNLDKKDMIY